MNDSESVFRLHAPYAPTGDQPAAIEALVDSVLAGNKYQTLLGVTGSGKTFTMANIIARLNKPALIIAHNKTLAAQLAQEFKEFFPENAVHYFVSYYDYYQPEAYVARSDTYIEKEATINAEIDRLRHATTASLLSRRDTIIVASVSCIYSLGEPEEYRRQMFSLEVGIHIAIERIIEHLIALQYQRATADFLPGTFRVKGDTLDIFLPGEETYLSLEFFGEELERISIKEPITNHTLETPPSVLIFPAKHFITTQALVSEVLPTIRQELDMRIEQFKQANELVKAERIKMRVEYDMEMLQEVGYVNGIENYSMYLSGRKFGDIPSTLLDFFPSDFITLVDESHMTLPQIRGMFRGDRVRKESLVEYGFRLPSALENRPLQFDEFEHKTNQMVCVSATPSDYERQASAVIATQIIRPTGLLDPLIEVRPMEYVADDLLKEIHAVQNRNERALITTITKKSSEELSEYLASNGIKVRYLHSEIETIERLEILRDLRTGKIDVIVGVNLLREGLDLPEVSFIGILDADKIGFLRSTSSLLQIIGRAARNERGFVAMYATADREGNPTMSTAMVEAIHITTERRAVQHAYNVEHGITPTTIVSSIKSLTIAGRAETPESDADSENAIPAGLNRAQYLKKLELEMDVASANLDFEEAARLRDRIFDIRQTKSTKN